MRLLTRSDFDGICCAVLLKELGVIDDMVYAHPKDLQDGKLKVSEDDVLANVPYVKGCGLWFDHHSSEQERLKLRGKFKGRSEASPSTARVVYNYYDGAKRLLRFAEMVNFADKVDSAQLTEKDILNPEGWVLLGFICDPRTGLGYQQNFRISNLQLMSELVERMRRLSIAEILALPDVKERTDRYFEDNRRFEKFLRERSMLDGPAVITDTRGLTDIPPGNRFLIYSIYPEANISVRLIDVKDGKSVSFSVGHSILYRTSRINVGSLMLRYGGGGHTTVGTCQVPAEDADRVLREIMEVVKAH